jgi:hypothetical protein
LRSGFGYLSATGGASAVEFAMVMPLLFCLILGIIGTCAFYYAQAQLDWAAEAGARHWALNSGLAADPVQVSSGSSASTSPGGWTYARYAGPALSGLWFQGTTETGLCANAGNASLPGYLIQGGATYNFSALWVNLPITITTSACFPAIY